MTKHDPLIALELNRAFAMDVAFDDMISAALARNDAAYAEAKELFWKLNSKGRGAAQEAAPNNHGD